MGFLRKVTGIKARNLGVETWRKEGADRVLQSADTKLLGKYTKMGQATISEWLELRPICEVCAKETGYEDGGRLRKQW